MTSAPSKFGRWADRALRPFADVRPGEGVLALPMAVLFFLVIGSYYLVKPVRNSLFVDRVGADNLPFVYIGTALAVGIIISWYSRAVVGRVHPRRLILGTYVFLAVNLVLFWWWLRYESLIVSGAFYIWVKIYVLLVVSQFWLVASVLFEPRQAKRLYGFVGAGGILGGIVGGSLAAATVHVLGTENILLAAAVVIALCGVLAMRLHRGGESARPTDAAGGIEATPADGSDRSPAALVRASPHLRAIAAILGLTIVVSTVMDWQMNKAVELFVPGEDAKTAFFGWFFAVLNAASFLVQMLLTSYVLRRFGIGVALLLLPVGLFTGALGILAHPGLWTAVFAKGAEGTLRYSLDQSTRELLYLPVPDAVKIRAKPFIDVAVYRAGTGLGGLVVLLATKVVEIPFQYMSLFNVAAIAVWIAVTFVMRREYVGSIKRLIRARDVEVDELVVQHLDADSRRELSQALESDDPQRVLYALELLGLAGEVQPEARVARLLRHPEYEVRERAAAALVTQGEAVLLTAAQSLLEDKDVDVRAEAVRLLCKHCVGDELGHFQMLLSDPRPRVRAGAIASFYGNPDPELRATAEGALGGLASQLGTEGTVYRREAALLTAVLPRTPPTRRVLRTLLDDPDEGVRRAAIVAAGRVGEREAVPILVKALTSPRLREEARDALAAFGDRILGALAGHLRDPSVPRDVRAQVARTFVEFPSPDSVEILLRALDDPDPGVRYHVLKTLNRLRRDHPELAGDAETVDRAIRREVDILKEIRGLRACLQDSTEPVRSGLWEQVVYERELEAVGRITRSLALVYPVNDMFHAYRALATPRPESRARGIELLDNVLRPGHRKTLIPVLERLGTADSGRGTEPLAPLAKFDPWLAACVAYAQWSGSGDLENAGMERSKMMKIVERAEFLRQVPMFSAVRTESLAKIAAVAKERSFETGEALFEQETPAEAIHFVVDGEVRALRDGEDLWVARRGDAVGALAVLDREPTAVSAIAAEPTRVLYVGDEEFHDLMLDSHSVTLGVIRFLAGEVRKLAAVTGPLVCRLS